MVVLLEIIAPAVADPPVELVPRIVTPLVGALELPRITLCALLAALVPLELAAVVLAVVESFALESSVSVSELVLVTPDTSEVVVSAMLAVLDPLVELTPVTMPVVELGEAAVLEPVVL